MIVINCSLIPAGQLEVREVSPVASQFARQPGAVADTSVGTVLCPKR